MILQMIIAGLLSQSGVLPPPDPPRIVVPGYLPVPPYIPVTIAPTACVHDTKSYRWARAGGLTLVPSDPSCDWSLGDGLR